MCSNIPASPAYVWKIYDFKIPLSSNSRYTPKNDADEASSVVSLTSSFGGYINGRNSANLELLIDKTSSIYLYVKLKILASLIFFSFTSF
jgi:nitrogen fixation protein